MKYIVFWTVVSIGSIPCPDAARPDEFGRSGGYTSCSVYHAKTEYLDHKKEFYDRDSANAFYKKALKLRSKKWPVLKEDGKIDSVYFYSDGDIINVKLDSIK